MTQEDKELLLKDLCARLPYGVKYLRESWNYEWDQEMSIIEVLVLEDIDKDGYINNTKVYTVEDIKPYLRPMSSMTDEEEEIRQELLDSSFSLTEYATLFLDFCNERHLDYRGLIDKGHAIEVTEENNPYKN